jgi:hypothetical protein
MLNANERLNKMKRDKCALDSIMQVNCDLDNTHLHNVWGLLGVVVGGNGR